MRVSLIVAVSRNLVIGTETGLPWRLSRDLKRFRALTLGKPVVMGRKTLEMIGRPLDGRPNIVLTRKRGHSSFPVARKDECPLFVHSAAEALAALPRPPRRQRSHGHRRRRSLSRVSALAERIYLTVVDAVVEGTATFPSELPAGTAWGDALGERTRRRARHQFPHTFHILDRIGVTASRPVELCAAAGVFLMPYSV
jgi:dihydrofolate reductase